MTVPPIDMDSYYRLSPSPHGEGGWRDQGAHGPPQVWVHHCLQGVATCIPMAATVSYYQLALRHFTFPGPPQVYPLQWKGVITAYKKWLRSAFFPQMAAGMALAMAARVSNFQQADGSSLGEQPVLAVPPWLMDIL